MGISTVPAFVPVDVATRLTALETASTRQLFMDNAKKVISGGGVPTVDTSFYVKWSQRFIMMGAGRSVALCPNGYFDIICPTSGTIIGAGGASNKTATAAGIPLAQWEALYYILPLGSPATSIQANFRVVNYTSDYVVSDDWILIAVRNGDGSGAVNAADDSVTFANGHTTTPWIVPALQNGWLIYGEPYSFRGFCKTNGIVSCQGIINGGTATSGTLIWTFPAGFRPKGLTHTAVAMGAAPYVGLLNIYPDGTVKCNTAVSSSWCGTDNIVFKVEN